MANIFFILQIYKRRVSRSRFSKLKLAYEIVTNELRSNFRRFISLQLLDSFLSVANAMSVSRGYPGGVPDQALPRFQPLRQAQLRPVLQGGVGRAELQLQFPRHVPARQPD